MTKVKKYFWNILISIDQFFNTLFAGDPDETISSRCGKRVHKNKLCKKICQLLEYYEYRHCPLSIEEDEGKDAVKK